MHRRFSLLLVALILVSSACAPSLQNDLAEEPAILNPVATEEVTSSDLPTGTPAPSQPPESTGEAPLPASTPYAFVFMSEAGLGYVAWLAVDATWHVDPLPELILLGQYDVNNIHPRWLGDTLYMTGFAPGIELPQVYGPEAGINGDIIGGALYRYDLATHAFNTIVESIIDPGTYHVDYLSINSISPNGRYVWLTGQMNTDSYLVDVERGQRLAARPCTLHVLAWLEREVVVSNTDFYGNRECERAVYTIDLETGEQSREIALPPPSYSEDFWLNYPVGGVLLDDQHILTTSWEDVPGVIDLLPLSGGPARHFGAGWSVSLSDSAQTVAFADFDDINHLKSLDLSTGTVQDLGLYTGPFHWEGETLHFWSAVEEGEDYRLYSAEAVNGSASQQLLYQGPHPEEIQLSTSATDYAALQLKAEDDQVYVRVFSAQGSVWDSREAFPEASMWFPWDIPHWTPDAHWLHLDYQPVPGQSSAAVSVNLSTGEVLPAPEQGARVVSHSPDGAWWLYVVKGVEFNLPGDRLIAYHLATGAQTVLFDDAVLYDSYHSPEHTSYIWRP